MEQKKRSGPKVKSTCAKGHDISEVGRTSSGNCKQCKRDYYRIRWQFASKNFNEKQP